MAGKCHPKFHTIVMAVGIWILSAVSGASAQNAPAVFTQADSDYLYRFLTDTCYLAPTALQSETLGIAERVFLSTLGMEQDPEALINDANSHLSDLKGAYPSYSVEYLGDGARFNKAPRELDLTRGLNRLVILSIANRAKEPISVDAWFSEAEPAYRPEISIPAGRTLPFLIPVFVDSGDFTTMTMCLNVASKNQVLNLDVPVKMLQAGIVKGSTWDSASGENYPSRVYAMGSDGIYRHARELAGVSTLSEKQNVFSTIQPSMRKLPFFYTKGQFVIDLPPGEAEFVLERGFETPLASEAVKVQQGQTTEVKLTSSREVDMKAQGWISGDTHIHWAINSWDQNEDIELLAMVQKAEDLRVANNLTLYQWRPDPPGPFLKPDQFPMGPVAEHSGEDYHLEMGEEFRNDNHYGHICLLNLKELVEPVATGPGSGGDKGALDYPINKTIIEQARGQGGISIEAHNLGPFLASGVPVNVVHGLSDSLDQLEPKHYYNFLNCGFRIGLSNGSDHPARLAGATRVYAHVSGEFSYQKWVDAVAEGRTFVTSGPLLFLQVNDLNIGDVIDTEPGMPLTAKARVWSRHPIGQLEIISNGAVVASMETEDTEAELVWEGTAEESRWFTARCTNSLQRDTLAGPGIAHTSAIYIDVDGMPVFRREAAEIWIQNIRIHRDRLEGQGNFANDEQRQKALEYVDEGIALYEGLIEKYGGAGE